MSDYTEDHLVEQPAIQLMQHELGWEVGENIEHRTLNIEHRSEEKKSPTTLERLNPDLPVEAIEGAVEERGILRKITGGASAESEFRGGGGMSALADGFQYFRRLHRLVKLIFLLKPHSIFTESGVSRMRESGDFVKIRPPSACALPRFRVADNFTVENQTFPHSPPAAIEVDFEDFSHKRPFSPKRENAKFRENLTNFHEMRLFHQSVK